MAIPAGQSRNNADGILMKWYPDHKMNDTINMRTPFMDRISSRPFTTAAGTDFSLPIRTALSSAGGDGDEWQDLPEADNVVNKFAAYNFRTYRRVIRLSGEIMTDGGSIIDPLMNEVQGAIDAAKLYRERAFFLGEDNILATMSAAAQHTSATVLEVDSSRNLLDNMKLDILVSNDGTTGDGVVSSRLTSISENSDGTADITISPGVNVFGNVGATYALYDTGTRNRGVFGLDDIVSESDPSTNDFGKIDRDTVSAWKANELAIGNKTLTPRLLAALITKVRLRSGITPTVLWGHEWVKNDLMQQVTNDKRFRGETKKLDRWGNQYHFDDIPFLTSRFCPKGTVYALNEKDLHVAYPKTFGKGSWQLSGNSVGTQLGLTQGKWGWQGLWISRWQFIARGCNAHGKATGIKNSELGTV